MSLNLPLRPLARSRPTSTILLPRRQVLLPQHRTIFDFFRYKGKGKAPLDPLSEDFLKKKDNLKLPKNEAPVPGSLSSSSIFDDGSASDSPQMATQKQRDITRMALALDPKPKARRRWLRKMTIRDIRNGGRVSKFVHIARTERQHLLKSPLLPTSVKKLMLLSRQIAGKTVEDAIVQMRYSKKKAARDVLTYLEAARDQAIVAKGMGLGKVGKPEGEASEKIEFVDKKGKRRTVTDQSAMYVDQAWVGRGSYIPEPEFRARGRVNILRHPTTSISVLLKEEATRIREAKEREEKKAKQKPWVHHPDKSIHRQSQYILW